MEVFGWFLRSKELLCLIRSRLLCVRVEELVVIEKVYICGWRCKIVCEVTALLLQGLKLRKWKCVCIDNTNKTGLVFNLHYIVAYLLTENSQTDVWNVARLQTSKSRMRRFLALLSAESVNLYYITQNICENDHRNKR